jgi:hypothetical protein
MSNSLKSNLLLRANYGEEGEDDARSACPFDILGYTHNTIGRTTGRDGVTLSQSFKPIASSDCGLQLDHMKPELLVIAGQLNRGEYVLRSCTHCPSTQGSRGHPKA